MKSTPASAAPARCSPASARASCPTCSASARRSPAACRSRPRSARARVMDAWPASSGEALHTSTFLGNPLACAAALANLAELERLDVVGAGARGRSLAARAAARAAPLPRVRDVRGVGIPVGGGVRRRRVREPGRRARPRARADPAAVGPDRDLDHARTAGHHRGRSVRRALDLFEGTVRACQEEP